MPPASWCARSARSCSAASATWSDASTRSWSRSSSWAASTFLVGLLPTYAAIGWARADPAGDAAARAGPGARRRVRRRGDLRRRARAARASAATTRLDPDHGDARLLPRAARDRPLPRRTWTPKEFAEWGWRIPFWLSLDPARLLGLHPAQAARVAGVPEDEGRGQGLEVAADRQLPQVSEQQVRAARAARRHGRPGRGLVHGPVLRAVLPDHHAQARLRVGVHADRRIAADRHAVLHLLRLAVGPDRPAEDHHGRLPDRGGHVLPAVPGPHALRQPGARGILGEDADHGRGDAIASSTSSSDRGASSPTATGSRTSSPSRACRSSRCRRKPARRS